MLRVFYLMILSVIVNSAEALAQLTNHAEIRPGLYFELWKRPSPHQPGSRAGGVGWGNTNLFQASEMIDYQISSTRAQAVTVGRLPQDRLFVLELRDASGRSVPKTSFGVDNSKPVDVTKKHARDLKIKNLGGVSMTSILLREAFRPEDYFVITNRGVYTLQAQIRIWTQTTNGQFGVVLSEPVRVEVQKR
jgi:hypothetical protein